MAIGGSAGYLTVNPTEDYVGQAIRGVGEQFQQVRAEKYQREKDKLIAEQNLQEQRRRDFKDSEEFSAKYPYASLGDNDKQFVMDLKKTYADAKRDVVNTGSEKSQALADKALSNLNRLNESKKAMSIKAEEMLKNEKDYNPTSFNKVKNLVARVNKDIVTRLDNNGNVVSDLVKRDVNGVVIGVEKKDISDAELKQMFEIEPKFDVTGEKGLVSQYIKSLNKPDVTTKTVGNKDITTTKYQGSEAMAKKMAQDATNNHSAVYAALEDLGLDPENKDYYTDEKVLKKVAGYYETLLNETTKESVSEKLNLDQANYNNKVKQQNIDNDISTKTLKVAQDKAKQDGVATVETTTKELTSEGKKFVERYKKANKGAMPFENEYPPNSYVIKKTSSKVKTSSGKTQQAPTKAELKAKADALRAKYAPKK